MILWCHQWEFLFEEIFVTCFCSFCFLQLFFSEWFAVVSVLQELAIDMVFLNVALISFMNVGQLFSLCFNSYSMSALYLSG